MQLIINIVISLSAKAALMTTATDNLNIYSYNSKNKNLLKILGYLLLFSLSSNYLSANTNANHPYKDIDIDFEIQRAAGASSYSLYNMDYETLKSIMSSFMINSSIEAIEIINKKSDKIVFQLYRDKENIIFDKQIPNTIKELYYKAQREVLHKGKTVGKIIIYYHTHFNRITLTENEKKFIDKHPVITYSDVDSKPMSFIKDNKMNGITKDYLDIVAKKTGIRFNFVPSSSRSEVVQKFLDKKIDLIPGAGNTLNEAKSGLLSDSYTQYPLAIITKKDFTINNGLADLESKTLAILKCYISYDFIRKKYPNINIVKVKSSKEALKLVSSGKVDAFIANMAVATYAIDTHHITNLKVAGFVDEECKQSFLVQKNIPELISIVNKVFESISEKEKIAIHTKWLPTYTKDLKVYKKLGLTKKEKEWIKDHPIINYSSNPGWSPFIFTDKDGKGIGIAADYIQKIEEFTGLKFKYNPAKTLINRVQKENTVSTDMIIDTTDSNLRPNLKFSKPFISNSIVIIMREDQEYIEDLCTIREKKIAVIKNHGYLSKIEQQYPAIRFHKVNNIKEGLIAVSKKKYDALLCTFALGSYTISDIGISNVKIVGKTPVVTNIGFGMKKEYEPLIKIINKALSHIDENTHYAILNKWVHQKYVERINYTLLWQIITGSLALLLVIILWNRRMAKEIRYRKKVEAELKQSQEGLELALKGGNLGSWDYNLETDELKVNERWAQMLGYDYDKLNDMHRDTWVNTIYKDDLIKVMNYGKEYKAGKHDIYEIVYRAVKLDDTIIWLLSKGSILEYTQDGRPKRMVGTVMDITAQKTFEEKLKIQKDKAEAATQAKSEFLANMSHEIRTPMNAIIGFTELLEGTELNSKQKSYLSSIKTGGKGLLTIINDILDLSKIEAGKLKIEYEPINPHKLFGELQQIFTQSIEEKELAFNINIDEKLPDTIVIDQTRLRQILFNLVGNAIKFTDHGYINLNIKAIDKDLVDGQSKIDLIIEVKDSGIGIPKEQQANIFHKFEQTDKQNRRKYGGTGLGLAICEKLSHMMNGKITLQSEIGRGSTFTVHLNDVAVGSISETNQKVTLIMQYIEFEPATVLIVDDIETNRVLIQEHFSQTPLKFIEAENGKIAVKLAKKYRPDLIIMDIRMPIMDGYEAANLIREDKETSKIPIIALTASVHEEKAKHLTESGFDEYLGKPVHKSQLTTAISNYLAHTCSLSEEINNKPDDSISFSQKTKDNLLEIIKKLKEDIKEDYDKAMNSGLFDDVASFTEKINEIGLNFEFEYLLNYSKMLNEYVESFDIEGIEKTLKQYKNIIELLSEEINNDKQ